VVLKHVRLEGRDALIDAAGQNPVIPGTSYSQAYHNISEFNGGGGFLVADDLGVNHDNVVAWNFATRNPGGCGGIVAGHSTAGVYGDVVGHNPLTYTGTLRKSPGARVVVATEVPHETVAYNTVIGNTIYGNGIAGVTIHGHLPGLRMAGNEVLDNNIGRNNTVGDTIGPAPPTRDNPDLRTTGILVGSSTHIAVVISGNHIHHEYYGIYIDALVRATFGGNHYRRVHTQVKFTSAALDPARAGLGSGRAGLGGLRAGSGPQAAQVLAPYAKVVASAWADGTWRSLVAHLTGGQGVAGSNPAVPTRRSRSEGVPDRNRGPFRSPGANRVT
jgi:hypothetical protein